MNFWPFKKKAKKEQLKPIPKYRIISKIERMPKRARLIELEFLDAHKKFKKVSYTLECEGYKTYPMEYNLETGARRYIGLSTDLVGCVSLIYKKDPTFVLGLDFVAFTDDEDNHHHYPNTQILYVNQGPVVDLEEYTDVNIGDIEEIKE